jgi:hypothetical protein
VFLYFKYQKLKPNIALCFQISPQRGAVKLRRQNPKKLKSSVFSHAALFFYVTKAKTPQFSPHNIYALWHK